MNYESDEAYEADDFHEVNRYERLPADPVRAAMQAMAKPPHVPFSSEYTDLTKAQLVPASNRDAARELVGRMNARRAREEQQRTQAQLIEDIEAGIRVLNNSVHGHSIPEAEINERARALVTMIYGNYAIVRLP